MIGFALDQSGDVVINNGKIEMVADEELTRQTVQTVVGTNKGEWFLQPDEGIDFHALLTKSPDYDEIKNELINGLKQVDEALTANEFKWQLSKDRRIKISFGNGTYSDFDYDISDYSQLASRPKINGVELDTNLNIYDISEMYSGTLPVSGWSNTAPYTQTITIDGITSKMTPIIDIVTASDTSTAKAEETAWGCITKAVTSKNEITFMCYYIKPRTAINFKIKAV